MSKLRDEFAGQAMVAIMPMYALAKVQMKMQMSLNEVMGEGSGLGTTSAMGAAMKFGDFNHDEVATEAYLIADAMLRAREGKSLLMDVLKDDEAPQDGGAPTK